MARRWRRALTRCATTINVPRLGSFSLNNPSKASRGARESLLTRPARLCEAAKNSSFLYCEEIEKEKKEGAERTTHARVGRCGGHLAYTRATQPTLPHVNAHTVAREGRGDWLRASTNANKTQICSHASRESNHGSGEREGWFLLKRKKKKEKKERYIKARALKGGGKKALHY